MRPWTLLIVLMSLASPPSFAGDEATRDIEVAPPAARVEIMPAPRVGHVWAPGFWAWNGKQHVWVAGRWMQERRGYRWVPDRWEQRGNLYHFAKGHWEPVVRTPARSSSTP